jgi:hypothetical protein
MSDYPGMSEIGNEGPKLLAGLVLRAVVLIGVLAALVYVFRGC